MKGTPASSRKHIVLFGDANAGKSSLFNALLNQPRAIVSDIPGTTTDPVVKAMELLPYGPVSLVDTAGLYDRGVLGAAREQKTKHWLALADLALYVIDPACYDETRFNETKDQFDKHKLPFLVVFMKSDLRQAESIVGDFERNNTARCYNVSVFDAASVENLRAAMAETLAAQTETEKSMIAGLVPTGGVVVLVIPIDSEAPAGRLILPQVQLIRDCLDHGVRCHVTTETQLAGAFEELAHVDLVVTDSQVFELVNKLTPPEIPLTSFSILTARRKGDFAGLRKGCEALKDLKPGDKILIAEACSHNTSHEDIGRVKLPRALEKLAGGKLEFTFAAGSAFSEDLSPYALVVHCGGCMLTPRAFAARQESSAGEHVPFTNYGFVLAAASGMLERSTSF